MENVNFPSGGECGEEIERALMDLGPLLGVTIKEEVPDEPPDRAASQGNVSGTNDGAGTSAAAESGGVGKAEGEGADSLASPTGRSLFLTMRCVFCQQCLAQTDGTPKLMECLHSACEPCVKAKIEEKLAGSRDFLGAGRVTILCAACRLHCQPSNMIDQRFVLEKMAMEQAGGAGGAGGEQQCNSCEEPEPASSYCVDCGEFICDSCVLAHQRLKITKDHAIKSRDEAVSELQAAERHAHDMFCRDHPHERLALFCETCDRLTCRDCQLQHHRDHRYQFSTEMAAQARASLAALLSEVSYKRVLLGSAMKVIRDRQALIADKKRALVHDITQTVVKLTNAVNTRGKQLVLRLNEVCDAKQRTLGEKKDALEQLAAITDHCVRFVGAALQHGSDTAVLHSKRAVAAHLQRIKSRRADIPNPEIPVRIALALDKLPDLVRVLSTLGAIVVDGKVDGGASPGPAAAPAAHAPPVPAAPPAPALAPAPPPPPHSAVAALQHVAMHQSYVQAVSCASGGALGYARARAHTPLRHPHVTSTTHPHHLHGMSEMNLRGLLNASGARRAPHAPHAPHAPMQHAYHQTGGAAAARARRPPRRRTPRTRTPPTPRTRSTPRTPPSGTYRSRPCPTAGWRRPARARAAAGAARWAAPTTRSRWGARAPTPPSPPPTPRRRAPASTARAARGAPAAAARPSWTRCARSPCRTSWRPSPSWTPTACRWWRSRAARTRRRPPSCTRPRTRARAARRAARAARGGRRPTRATPAAAPTPTRTGAPCAWTAASSCAATSAPRCSTSTATSPPSRSCPTRASPGSACCASTSRTSRTRRARAGAGARAAGCWRGARAAWWSASRWSCTASTSCRWRSAGRRRARARARRAWTPSACACSRARRRATRRWRSSWPTCACCSAPPTACTRRTRRCTATRAASRSSSTRSCSSGCPSTRTGAATASRPPSARAATSGRRTAGVLTFDCHFINR